MKRYRKTMTDTPEDVSYIRAEGKSPYVHSLKKFVYPVYISVNTYIDIHRDGEWEWEDESIAQSVELGGDWYLDSVTTFYGKWDISSGDYLAVTGEQALENLTEIMQPHIPTSWGRYRVKVDATLAYDVTNGEYFYDDSVDDFEFYDNYDVKFNIDLSQIKANSMRIDKAESEE